MLKGERVRCAGLHHAQEIFLREQEKRHADAPRQTQDVVRQRESSFALLSDKWSRESVLLETSFSLTGQSVVVTTAA